MGALLKSWQATSGALKKKEENIRPALRAKMASTHPYLAPFAGSHPVFTRQERITTLFTMIFAKMCVGTLFFGNSNGSFGARLFLAVIISLVVIPIAFIMKYLFSYDVASVNKAANRKAKRVEQRKKRAERRKEEEKRKTSGASQISLKYAVMAKKQEVQEAV